MGKWTTIAEAAIEVLAKRKGGALPAAQPTSGSGDAMVDVLRPIDENSLLWLSQQPVGRMPPRPVEELRPYRPSPFQRIGNFAQDAMQGAGMDRYAAHTLRGQLFGAQGDKGRGIGVADFVPGLDTSAAADDYRANPGLLTGAGVGLSMLPLVGGFAAKGIGRLGRGLLDDVPTSMFDVDPTMPAKLVNPEMRVWQGGPNRYGPDVPGTKAGLDSSKIGTGEGAQVYGHGHYLAQRRGIGEYYRDALAKGDLLFRKDGTPIPMDPAGAMTPQGTFSSFSRGYGNLDDAAKGLREQVTAIDDGTSIVFKQRDVPAEKIREIREGYAGALDWYAKNRDDLIIKRNPGHLYEYDLPDETIAKMLDWDAPYDKQPENVRASIRKLWLDKGGDPSVARPWAAHSEADGESIRAAIESSYGPGGSQEALREAGIPGIRYLDQGSRGPMQWELLGPSETTTGKWRVKQFGGANAQNFNTEAEARAFMDANAGTSNFVLFDDDAAKLLARDDTRFDLPTDEASRMARAREMGFDVETPMFHGTSADITSFAPSMGGSATGAKTGKMAIWLTDDPVTAKGYARHAATNAPVKKILREANEAADKGNWDLHEKKIAEAEILEKQIGEEGGLRGQNILPLYAPKDDEFRSIWDKAGELPSGLFVKNMNGRSFDDFGVSDEIQQILIGAKRDGHKGVKFENLDDAPGLYNRPATHVAIFDPKNIRSTNAQFDPAKKDSADILAGLGVVGAGAALSQQDGFDYGALSNVAEESNGQRSN
jgi:hypothetical protein